MTDRLVHELVEQSRDRVAHVRAGQRLLDVLDTQGDGGSLTYQLPTASALVRQIQPTHVTGASGLRTTLRKRAAVVLTPEVVPASSYTQYAIYTDSKSLPTNSVHALDRRKAMATTPPQLTTLVARVTDDATAVARLGKAVAVAKGRNAFIRLKKHKVPHPDPIKNTHLAFLEFQATEAMVTTTVPNLPYLNAPTHEPIRFGDVVCLLSCKSNVPLAIGRNGRTITVVDTVTGPHMLFTIVDFRDPSRRDDVLIGEAFWLRVDASQLERGHEDELMALVVDTQYYLGGPGAREEGQQDDRGLRRGVSNKYHVPAERDDVFKLVTMKAEVPSVSYYGDDDATREYALETNPSIVRLAQWQFTDPKRTDGHDGQLVLNCATVGLRLGALTLEFDARRQRGVLCGSIARDDTKRSKRPRESMAWQVRLMRRGEPQVPSASHSANNSRPPTDQASLEWLQFHHDRVERDTKAIDKKRTLAREAHTAYDNVAAKSNAMLVQIETTKALHHRTYFANRFPEVVKQEHPSKSHPHNHIPTTKLPRL